MKLSEFVNRRVASNESARGKYSQSRILATLILLLAAGLRLFMLQDVPPGLHQDEVLDADIALFIRQGQHALFFREGYGHEPLYHYLAVPFAPLLGDNFLAVRLPSVFLGLFLVALTMGWTRRKFGTLPALVAGAGLAISWWPIIFSRIGIRPILLPVLLMLAFWFWPIPGMKRDADDADGADYAVERAHHPFAPAGLFRDWRPLAAALFLGLAIYSYTAARVVLLIPLFFLLYLLAVRAKRQHLRKTAVIFLVALLLFLPLYLTLRADPSLQQRVEQLEGPLAALRQGDARPVLAMSAATLGVVTFSGDPRWTYSLPARPFFDLFTGLFFYGGVLLALLKARREPRQAFVLIWLAVCLLPSAITPDAPSSVRLVGAMPVVYLLPALALQRILAAGSRIASRYGRGQFSLPNLLFTLLLLATLFGLNLGRTIRDGFVLWPAQVETGLRYQTHFLDIARHWQRDASHTPVIADSWYEPIDHDSVRRNLGRDLPARWIQSGRALVFPAAGNGRLYLPEFVALDPLLLEVAALPAVPAGESVRRPSLAIYELPPEPWLPPLDEPVAFDEKVTLLGYRLSPDGAALAVVTLWRVEAELPWDLAIFMHLVGPGNQVLAQDDALDAVPERLRPGDTVLQLHRLPLPPQRPPGSYRLLVGLYTRSDGRRMRLVDQTSEYWVLVEDLNFDESYGRR